MIKIGTDFTGVGSVNQALKRLNIPFKEVFACEMDKYARQTYIHNYGEPEYYPKDVYEREIPKEPLDIYVTTPPCQSFSLAGKRKGEEDKRGVLFYNSHEFIQVNKPRYFCFENVKGLLSDDSGKTFQRWIDLLGGKSVNGNPVIFPHEESVPYHVYYQVLNAKDYGVPQNRERIFIIGIRDDADNNFTFLKPFPLTKRLKDVFEENVDEKYYLSEKMVDGFIGLNPNGVARTIRCGGGSSKDDKHNWDLLKVGYINQDTQASQVFSQESVSQTLCAGTHGYANGYVQIGAIRGRNPDNPNSRESGLPTMQMLEINENGTSNCLTTVQKDNVVVEKKQIIIDDIYNNIEERIYTEFSPTIRSERQGLKVNDTYKIRKLTPRECFRLMDFPDTFDFSVVSDSQAYKQAGNSVVVKMWELIFTKLFLK